MGLAGVWELRGSGLTWTERSWPGQTMQVLVGHVKDFSPPPENNIKVLKAFHV